MEKRVAAHAEADGIAFFNPELVEQSEGVESALTVSDCLWRIGGAAVASRVGCDERVVLRELIAAGVNPVLVATASTVQKQQRFS
ncbi:MAG TPA: hypothetical protein VFE61_32725 [Candidatus Sulfotelmatobacter sp.]|nr:hypothetical protein [Candidatus Sulfotelmatobacter sp.]